MSYMYGAVCKARNFNIVYIWTSVWQRWKSSVSICCRMFQHWFNGEIYPVAQLCLNTFLATKVTLITYGIYFGSLRVKHKIIRLSQVIYANGHRKLFRFTRLVVFRFKVLFYRGNNSVPKLIFRLSRFQLYRASGLGRFYCIRTDARISEVGHTSAT
jgi:hypothetical protein